MPAQFPEVWFTTHAKFHNPVKFIVYSDKGRLDIRASEFQYLGRKHQFTIREIKRLDLGRQPFPWFTLVLSNTLILLMMAAGMFSFFTMDNPATIPLLVILSLLLVLMWWVQKWVTVEYVDEAGATQLAHFCNGGSLGWSGILGGTNTLYEAMETHCQPGVP